uniref:Helicase n=1 Tax=Pseudomonas phage Touem01 TaxID=3138548 RepID=A0AAU6W1Q5_9VIRU
MKITPRDYQQELMDKVLLSFRSGKRSPLVVAATGAGKCLAAGTPILMFDGTIKAVEDVVVDDLVMGPDSRPRRVESLATGIEAMYRIIPNKGDPYVVNESHVLSLKITGIGSRRLSAPDGQMLKAGDICNITVSDYLRGSRTFKHCAKGWRAGVDFHAGLPLPMPAYILGAWLGDGMTGKLSFTTGDNEIAKEFAKYAKRVGMVFRIEQNSDWSVNVHLNSAGAKYGRGGSPFGNALRSLGIFNEKRIPHIYKTASRRSRLDLLAGIIDTDGHYDQKGFQLTLKSEVLLDDVIFVARSLGFACYKRSIQKTCHNNGVVGTYWSCHINGDIEQVPCRLRRKQPKPRRINKDPLVTGISVEPVGEGRYYGFELSGPDRLFLLGDFTVTHNTVVFSAIASRASQKGNKVLILAHRDTLIKQASGKLKDYEVQHGIIMASFTPDALAKVQVASVQTLVRRLGKMRFVPDLIIIDEAHLSAAKSYLAILEHFSKALVIGFTGSPCRLDNKPLGKESGGIYDDLIQAISIKQLIERGFLVRPVVFGAEEALDLSGIKQSMGDYKVDELAAVVDKPKITGDAVKQYQKICNGAPAVAWCVTVEHAQHVADAFNANGIRAVMLCGEHDTDFRDKTLKGLETGEVQVVTFVGILIEGVDCPAISAIILLRPTMSLASYLQVIGRGLRPYTLPSGEKKEVCYVLDHAGLWMKHGFADEEREWELNGEVKKKGKKKDKEPTVDLIQCRGCFAVFSPTQAAEAAQKRAADMGLEPGAPCCPNCFKAIEVKTRKLEQVDGELAEITPEMVAAMRKDTQREQGSAKSLEDLKALGAKLGRSPKWAEHVFNARQSKKAKPRPKPPVIELPPVPTEIELSVMSLEELEKVRLAQGWPISWPVQYFNEIRGNQS